MKFSWQMLAWYLQDRNSTQLGTIEPFVVFVFVWFPLEMFVSQFHCILFFQSFYLFYSRMSPRTNGPGHMVEMWNLNSIFFICYCCRWEMNNEKVLAPHFHINVDFDVCSRSLNYNTDLAKWMSFVLHIVTHFEERKRKRQFQQRTKWGNQLQTVQFIWRKGMWIVCN